VINDRPPLSRRVRAFRVVDNGVGLGELACIGYLWYCAIARRHDRWLGVSVSVLTGEGVALLVADGCPLGIFQRQAGDNVPMFELWFGPRLAPLAVPTFTLLAGGGLAVVLTQGPGKPGFARRSAYLPVAEHAQRIRGVATARHVRAPCRTAAML
jgi:hypothetical protein